MRKLPPNPDELGRLDLDDILGTIDHEVRQRFGEGEVADYIPSLAEVPKDRFGMALAMLDGTVHAVGDACEGFSIQSISKLYTLTMALEAAGDALWTRVDREPSGDPFNSLIQLELERGIPRNPFMNAGALVVADVVLSSYDDAGQAKRPNVPEGCRENHGQSGMIAGESDDPLRIGKRQDRHASIA